MRRTPSRWLFVMLLVSFAAPAAGAPADGDRPKPRPRPPAAKPAEAAALRPALDLTPPAAVSLASPMQSGAPFAGSGIATGGLAAHGLHSTLPAVGDSTPLCRAACAKARLFCATDENALDCAPKWATCMVHCTH